MAAQKWCNTCQAYTEASDRTSVLAVCGRCGEAYQCDECGFEIDRAGNCLRGEAGAGECAGGRATRWN